MYIKQENEVMSPVTDDSTVTSQNTNHTHNTPNHATRVNTNTTTTPPTNFSQLATNIDHTHNTASRVLSFNTNMATSPTNLSNLAIDTTRLSAIRAAIQSTPTTYNSTAKLTFSKNSNTPHAQPHIYGYVKTELWFWKPNVVIETMKTLFKEFPNTFNNNIKNFVSKMKVAQEKLYSETGEHLKYKTSSNGRQYYFEILTYLLTEEDSAYHHYNETVMTFYQTLVSPAFTDIYKETMIHQYNSTHVHVKDYNDIAKLSLSMVENEPPGNYVKFSNVYETALTLWPTDDPFSTWTSAFNKSMFGRDNIPKEAALRTNNFKKN